MHTVDQCETLPLKSNLISMAIESRSIWPITPFFYCASILIRLGLKLFNGFFADSDRSIRSSMLTIISIHLHCRLLSMRLFTGVSFPDITRSVQWRRQLCVAGGRGGGARSIWGSNPHLHNSCDFDGITFSRGGGLNDVMFPNWAKLAKLFYILLVKRIIVYLLVRR